MNVEECKVGTIITVFYTPAGVDYKLFNLSPVTAFPDNPSPGYYVGQESGTGRRNPHVLTWIPYQKQWSMLSMPQMAAVVNNWPHLVDEPGVEYTDNRTVQLPPFAQIGKSQPL